MKPPKKPDCFSLNGPYSREYDRKDKGYAILDNERWPIAFGMHKEQADVIIYLLNKAEYDLTNGEKK